MSFLDKSMQYNQSAIRATGMTNANRKTTVEAPGKTAGGFLGSAGGMALAGMKGASMMGVTGPQGAMIGGAVGALSYLLS